MRIPLRLPPNRRIRPMPTNHFRILRQHQQLRLDARQNLPPIAPRQIRPPNAIPKQSIPRDQRLLRRNVQTRAALRMPRRMQHMHPVIAKPQRVAVFGFRINRRLLRRLPPRRNLLRLEPH